MFQTFVKLNVAILLVSVLFIVGCSAQQTEEQALQSLRQMTSTGKLPPEDFVSNLESRFAGKHTGALAKLLRGVDQARTKRFRRSRRSLELGRF